MKRVGILILGVCIVLSSAAAGYAWFGFGEKKSQKPAEEKAVEAQQATKQPAAKAAAATAPKIDKDVEKILKEKREAIQKKMALLNNTEWQVELTPLSGKGKKESETITFKNNQVSMANFAKKGFPATNITLTVQDDGSVIWETMQTSEKSGICFWRGEMDKAMTAMRGVLSHKIDDKNKIDYSLQSIGRKSLPGG